MTLSNQKANHGDHIDRISDLPRNVIDGILEHLDIRDVVRTSILSRRWRYMWTSVPRLEFWEEFFEGFKHLDDPGPEISRIITEVLLLHDGPVHKFTLYITHESKFMITIEYLNKWILFLSRRGIKELMLVNLGTVPPQIPYHVFSCHELTYFELGGFNLSIQPNFCGFKSLHDLHLEYMKLEYSDLASLISGCPLLEELGISFCYGFECFDFSAPTLKVLRIEFDQDIELVCLKKAERLVDLTLMIDRDRVSGLIKSLPNIQKLVMGSWRNENEILCADIIPLTLLINSVSSLEFLMLNVNLNERGELLYIVSVLKSASNLVELIIKSSSHFGTTQVLPDHSEELECSSCCLGQLQTVDIKVKASCQHAMSLIRFILANSPSLETLTFDVFGLGSKQSDAPMFRISRDLFQMKRASQKAKVEFLHDTTPASVDHGAVEERPIGPVQAEVEGQTRPQRKINQPPRLKDYVCYKK